MAPSPVVRLVAAALAVVVLASCADDEPEPVATDGGLELSSTTTEQPRITEPPDPTTTSTTTTTTAPATTTTTTTTVPEPTGPTVDELLALLPGADALPGGDWTRTDGPTTPPEEGDEPLPLCEGAGGPTALAPMLYDNTVADGAGARYVRPDETSRIRLVIAPVADVGALVDAARTDLEACATGPQPATVLAWDPIGEGSVAWSLTQESQVGPDAGVPGTQVATFVIAHVGGIAVTLNHQSIVVEGAGLPAPPTDAEIEAFVRAAVDGVGSLA